MPVVPAVLIARAMAITSSSAIGGIGVQRVLAKSLGRADKLKAYSTIQILLCSTLAFIAQTFNNVRVSDGLRWHGSEFRQIHRQTMQLSLQLLERSNVDRFDLMFGQ